MTSSKVPPLRGPTNAIASLGLGAVPARLWRGKSLVILAIPAALTLSIVFGYGVATESPEGLSQALRIVLLGVLAIPVLRWPHLGIVAAVASLPLLELLPPIPVATSIVSALGGITLCSFVAQRRWGASRRAGVRFASGHLWSLVFVGWVFLSNPSAALFRGDRNWLFTFAQLWILAWLAGELLTTPPRHRLFMWVFSSMAIVSALFAIREAVIGDTLANTIRGDGLAEGSNSAARYFVVAMVFLNYLRGVATKPGIRLLTLGGMTFLALGVAYTVSRTGLLLLIGAMGMLFLQSVSGRRKWQAGVILATAMITIWFIPDEVFGILNSQFASSIRLGTDTVGLRYNLWRAGLRMWSDHLLQGVGIGQFSTNLPLYARDLLEPHRFGLGPHSLYVALLAETGLVGFAFFGAFLLTSLMSLIHASRSGVPEARRLAETWLIVLVVLLIGGLTKHDQYDKLLWTALGVGQAIGRHPGLQGNGQHVEGADREMV